MFANTPKPPYYAVIFTSTMKNDEGYQGMSEKMGQLVKQQEGFLGIESARSDIGITVSYWDSLEAIKKWKLNVEHLEAQQKGRNSWYKNYHVRIAKVERDYIF